MDENDQQGRKWSLAFIYSYNLHPRPDGLLPSFLPVSESAPLTPHYLVLGLLALLASQMKHSIIMQ